MKRIRELVGVLTEDSVVGNDDDECSEGSIENLNRFVEFNTVHRHQPRSIEQLMETTGLDDKNM